MEGRRASSSSSSSSSPGPLRRPRPPPSPPSPLPLSFSRNSRAVRCSVAHFQLRNLLYTPSLHEAYVVHASRLVHWDSVTRERTVVLDLSGSNNNGLGGGFGAGGDVTPRASLTPADQPLPHELGFSIMAASAAAL